MSLLLGLLSCLALLYAARWILGGLALFSKTAAAVRDLFDDGIDD
jgi:hypothetical protein